MERRVNEPLAYQPLGPKSVKANGFEVVLDLRCRAPIPKGLSAESIYPSAPAFHPSKVQHLHLNRFTRLIAGVVFGSCGNRHLIVQMIGSVPRRG